MSVYVLALIFASIVGIILSVALLIPGRKDVVTARLEQMKAAPVFHKKEEKKPFFKNIASAVANLFPPPQEKRLSRYQALLLHAGFRLEENVMFFYGLKVILTVALPLVFVVTAFRFFGPQAGFLITALLTFIGFFAVDGYLKHKGRIRQEAIFHDMPDVLDLLAIIVEAGMGLDSAMKRVSEEQALAKTILAGELKQVSNEIMVGLPRADALRNLFRRTGQDDIRAFTDMLIQTERFGTSISQALKSFSENLRRRRMQIAEEAAAKTTIKLVFPLVFCIFPTIFIVLLGPAMITMYKTFAK